MLPAVKQDIKFILDHHFQGKTIKKNEFKISKAARHSNQIFILKLFGFKSISKEQLLIIEKKAISLIPIYAKPIFIFRELYNFLINNRIVIPGYSTLQKIIGKTIVAEKKRLEKIVNDEIPSQIMASIKLVLSEESGRYKLTILKKAISYAYSGKFRVKTEVEQNIWDECSRFVANCIIFYNMSILHMVYSDFKMSGKDKEAEKIVKISPAAWRHINLRGNYIFSKKEEVNLDKIMKHILKMSIKEFSIDQENYYRKK